MDDIIDEDDIAYVKGIIAGTEDKTQYADANYDGTINEADISQIESIIAGDEVTLTIVDNEGVTVTLDTPVESVAPLMFSPLQLLVQLDSADKISGVGNILRGKESSKPEMAKKSLALQGYPELQDLPDIGSGAEPSNEAIILVNPDVIIGTSHTNTEIAELLTQNTGVPFLNFDPEEGFDSEDGAYEDWRILGLILGNDARDRAEELIQYSDGKIQKIKDIISNIPDKDKQRVYLTESSRGEITSTPCYYGPINVAGGINVADGLMPNGKMGRTDVSLEQIYAWQPDVLLLHCTSGLSVDEVLSDPTLQILDSVKNERVYNTKAWFNGWDPATGLCECLYLAKLFYPDEFNNLNVEDECNEILMEFYGVSGLYDYMLNNGYDLFTWR